MEQEKQTKVSSFLSGLLPQVEVNTQVGLNSRNLMEAAAIVFIAATLIILAYFSMKTLFK